MRLLQCYGQCEECLLFMFSICTHSGRKANGGKADVVPIQIMPRLRFIELLGQIMAQRVHGRTPKMSAAPIGS